MTSTLTEQAVAGRRVEFMYYRDLPDGPARPGIITGTAPGIGDGLLAVVRLDGKRSALDVPVDYQGLTYLDEVVPVPDLPAGPFIPTAAHPDGFQEKADVLVTAVGEDGEDLIAITTDRSAAVTALRAWAVHLGYDVDYLDFDRMTARWGVFDWEPVDPEHPYRADHWFVSWDAQESDTGSVHIFHLPTE
jgi:hypothetical protein